MTNNNNRLIKTTSIKCKKGRSENKKNGSEQQDDQISGDRRAGDLGPIGVLVGLVTAMIGMAAVWGDIV